MREQTYTNDYGYGWLTRLVQDKVSWCMPFVDDIVFADENRHGVNVKLDIWKDAIKLKAFS